MRGVIIESTIIYSTGRKWLKGKPHWEQKLVPHRHYLVDTLKERLIPAGPFMDHTGGLVIVEVDNLEEAENVAKNDPAVLEEKFEYKVHPWEPLEGLFRNEK